MRRRSQRFAEFKLKQEGNLWVLELYEADFSQDWVLLWGPPWKMTLRETFRNKSAALKRRAEINKDRPNLMKSY